MGREGVIRAEPRGTKLGHRRVALVDRELGRKDQELGIVGF